MAVLGLPLLGKELDAASVQFFNKADSVSEPKRVVC